MIVSYNGITFRPCMWLSRASILYRSMRKRARAHTRAVVSPRRFGGIFVFAAHFLDHLFTRMSAMTRPAVAGPPSPGLPPFAPRLASRLSFTPHLFRSLHSLPRDSASSEPFCHVLLPGRSSAFLSIYHARCCHRGTPLQTGCAEITIPRCLTT